MEFQLNIDIYFTNELLLSHVAIGHLSLTHL